MKLVLSPSVLALMPEAKMPLKYDEAINALVACRSVDEAKYYSDKAEALAAWAKIYKSDRASMEARRLKLHAYRRMYELAGVVAKTNKTPDRTPGNRRRSTANVELKLAGLSQTQVWRASNIGRLPPATFDSAIERGLGTTRAAMLYDTDRMSSPASDSLAYLRNLRPHKSAAEIAKGFSPGETKAARRCIQGLIDWLDEVDQYLPKDVQ